MPLSDEQKESIMKIMVDVWGDAATQFFGNFLKGAEDMGVKDEHMYDTLVKSASMAKYTKGAMTREELHAVMSTSYVDFAGQGAPKAEAPKAEAPKTDVSETDALKDKN